MSFGSSIGDIVLITQLASSVVQNARKACGAHDGLTRELTCLHIALRRLQSEASKPKSLLNSTADDRKDELATLIEECSVILRVLSEILEKYNALSEEKRSITKLWQKVRFGNGEMQDLSKLRLQLVTYTAAITMFINTLTLGSQGKVEEYMTLQGGELKGIRRSLDWITASMQASSGNTEGSILTSYTDDDKAIWKDFRRELIQQGYSSDFLKEHKETIQNYVLELGQRGALDELTGGECDRVEGAQNYEAAPIQGEHSEKTVESHVSLLETSLSAAADIAASDIAVHDESDRSDETGSTESNGTWRSEEFYNHPSQKPRKSGNKTEFTGERGIQPVEVSSSGRDELKVTNSGRHARYRSPSSISSECRKRWDVSDSDSDVFNQQPRNIRKKPIDSMTMPELDVELKRIYRESEDVSRKLKLYKEEPQRAYSLRNMFKKIFFNMTPDEPGISSVFESIDSLASRQSFIRKHKIRIENRIATLQSGLKKAVPNSLSGHVSSFNTTTNVSSSNHSSLVGGQKPILLASFAHAPKFRSRRRNSGISGLVPTTKPHGKGNGHISISQGQTQSLETLEADFDDFLHEMDTWLGSTSKIGFFAEFKYIVFFPPDVSRGQDRISANLDELRRPSVNHVRALEKAWKILLRERGKDREKTPNREEFIAGVNLATQALIRFLEFVGTVAEEHIGMELMARNYTMGYVFRKAIEEELRRNERQLKNQKPLARLNSMSYRFLLSGAVS